MIATLTRFFKSLLLGLSSLISRALCFLNRKRRNSGAILPTHIQDADVNIPTHVLSDNFQNHSPSNDALLSQEQLQDSPIVEDLPEEGYSEWDTWDKPVASVPNSDSQPQNVSSKQPVVEPEPEPDYFSDLGLAPTIQKQKKVLIKSSGASSHQASQGSNRLAFSPDSATLMTTDLEEWDESGGAWEDEDLTLETEQALRQTRKAERERRMAEHQRRNQEKEQKKQSKDTGRLATKLS
ncbi:receptor-binding cancer antigen expressed on SiSo cells-like [Watersipora subatra]|uniref:receptor-binding cancer antigen expressed on SiSo cells-like n=1 Tax=Watersipora subatra TaxID=2589382 RepID=UPI00355BC402